MRIDSDLKTHILSVTCPSCKARPRTFCMSYGGNRIFVFHRERRELGKIAQRYHTPRGTECVCNLRQRLLGDGCEHCNPELTATAKEGSSDPAA